MLHFLPCVQFKNFLHQFGGQVLRCDHILKVQQQVRPFHLFSSFNDKAGFTKSTRTNQYQMVFTFHHTHDILQLLSAVGEKLILYDSAEFKRVSHIAKFFVAKFFAKIGVLRFAVNKNRENC